MQSTKNNPLIDIKDKFSKIIHFTKKGEILTIHGIDAATEEDKKAIISTLSNSEIMQYYKSGTLNEVEAKNRIDIWKTKFIEQEPKLLHLLIKKENEYIGKIGLCYEKNSRVQIWFLTDQKIDQSTMIEIGNVVESLLLDINVGVYGTYHPDNQTEQAFFENIKLDLKTKEPQMVQNTGKRHIMANHHIKMEELLKDIICKEAIKSSNTEEESKEAPKTWLEARQVSKTHTSELSL
jgi:hypothetical protein